MRFPAIYTTSVLLYYGAGLCSAAVFMNQLLHSEKVLGSNLVADRGLRGFLPFSPTVQKHTDYRLHPL